MIELGKKQKLKINRFASIGAYLIDKEQTQEVLLPKKQLPEDASEGMSIDVFIYKDSEDRLIATTQTPKMVLGEIQLLKVVDVNRIGAFLDWGLEKDLFLPFSEQTIRVQKGKAYLVSLYIDKSERLSATMDIYKLLKTQAPYQVDDAVEGIIYRIHENYGAFVAIDNKYHGLIPRNEWFGNYEVGSKIIGRITGLREDGKLNISLKQKAYLQMDEDAELLLEKLEENGGILKLNDKSAPEDINNILHMSKSAFKRAVGRLLKQGRIQFDDKQNGIQLIKRD